MKELISNELINRIRESKSNAEARRYIMIALTKAKEEVDAYCPNCEVYIVNERVTFEETCDQCNTEIEWHTAEQPKNEQTTKALDIRQARKFLESKGISKAETTWGYYIADLLEEYASSKLPSEEEIDHKNDCYPLENACNECLKKFEEWKKEQLKK